MIGLITLSLPALIERIERSVAMGAREFQISLPSWGPLTDSELATFFRETCGRFPDCKFLLYNLLRTKRLVTASEFARYAEEYPNLVATKHGTGDILLIGDLIQKAPQLRHFFTEPGFAYGSLLGDPGLLISIASTNPARALEYFEAGVARDVGKLMALQHELLRVRTELMAAAGTAHIDGAYDKIFARILDPKFPLALMPPYEGVSEATFEAYRTALQQKLPQWLPGQN